MTVLILFFFSLINHFQLHRLIFEFTGFIEIQQILTSLDV